MIPTAMLAATGILSNLVFLAPGGPPQGRALREVPANAGTGPFEISSISGITEYGGGDSVGLGAAARAATRLLGLISGYKQGGSLRAIRDQVTLLVRLAQRLDRRAPKGRINIPTVTLLDDLNGLVSGTQNISDLNLAATKILTTISGYIDRDVKAVAGADRRRQLGEIKVGTYWRSSGAYAFDGIAYSPLESRLSHALRLAPFLTASALFPTSGFDSPGSGTLGVGLAFGNPDRYVAALTLASFLSPCAVDAEASLSFKLRPGRQVAGNLPDGLKPSLLDHIRAGDVWFGGSLRAISYSRSSQLLDTDIAEGVLTIALSQKDQPNYVNPTLATTLTVSAIYCPRRTMGVDELGCELRAPIAGVDIGQHAVFASARYGTRGSFTVSFETRF